MNYSVQEASQAKSCHVRFRFRRFITALATMLLAAGVSVTALWHRQVDDPISTTVNTLARLHPTFDYLVLALTRYDHLEGVGLVALLWYLWFKVPDSETRAQVVAGVIGAACAGAASRLLQLLLPTHPRPLHDPGLHFLAPLGVNPHLLSYWNSFPSDHAALFFGLGASICMLDRKLGALALGASAIVTLGRIYEGYHSASDILGGAGLGILAVCLAQASPLRPCVLWIVALERGKAPLFYMLAFMLSYQVSTLFDDVRSVGVDYARVFFPHAPVP